MGRWLERKREWLRNENTSDRPVGRPKDESLDYGVVYIPIRCPKCNSKDTRCYASRPPIRYHVCNVCKCNFKSVEREIEK